MTGTGLLDVRELHVYYERRRVLAKPLVVQAVRGVSFRIGVRETFGLVGESGSGKSTIGRAILCLTPIAAGDIVFDGRSLRSFGRTPPRAYRRRVQVVFQDPLGSLNPRLSVASTLGEAVRRHQVVSRRLADEHVRQLLDDVGLAAYHAGKHPHELSGGQQQRVAIARALAPAPDVIVCDEAVSALDVSTQSQILNLLQDLQDARGLSYLFISHDLSVVRHISDRIGILKRGELVELGDTETIYGRPRDPYTQALLDAVPTIRADVRG